MATSNVQNINTALPNSNSVKTTQEMLEEHRREKERVKYLRELQTDSVTVVNKKIGVAGAAEPLKPPAKLLSPHEEIQEARQDLKKAFVEAGGKASKETEQNLETVSADQVEKVQNEIDTLIEQGAPEGQITRLESKRDVLLGALDKYREAHREAEGTAELGEVKEVAVTSVTSDFEEVEQGLWTELDTQFKGIGIERGGETNVDEIQKKFVARIGVEVAQIQGQEKDLTEKFNEVHTAWKTTTDPKKKAELEKALNEIKTISTQIIQRKLDLQKSVANFTATSDALLSYHVSKELGLPARKKVVAKKQAMVQSASVAQSNLTIPEREESSHAVLGIQSVSERTASAPEGDSYVSDSAALSIAAVEDQSTLMAIQATGGNQRSEAKRLDKLIKRLILAAQSGNMEAVVSGLLFLGKRSNVLTTSMGAQMLVAMQQYEKQMGVISNQMGALKPGSDYGSKLSKLNADMNIYSSSRQMITQTFRDFLNMKEQVDELAHSVIGKLGQLGSRLASFQ